MNFVIIHAIFIYTFCFSSLFVIMCIFEIHYFSLFPSEAS